MSITAVCAGGILCDGRKNSGAIERAVGRVGLAAIKARPRKAISALVSGNDVFIQQEQNLVGYPNKNSPSFGSLHTLPHAVATHAGHARLPALLQKYFYHHFLFSAFKVEVSSPEWKSAAFQCDNGDPSGLQYIRPHNEITRFSSPVCTVRWVPHDYQDKYMRVDGWPRHAASSQVTFHHLLII